MKRKILISFFIVMISASVCFAKDNVTREYTFTSKGKDFKYEENQNIKVDGTEYKTKDVKYEVISKTPLSIEKEYSNLEKKEVPNTIKEKNTEYKLAKEEYKEVKETAEETFTAVGEFEVPKEKNITKDGKIHKGNLKDVKTRLSNNFDTHFEVTGIFYGEPDVYEYDLNGTKIAASTAPAFSGFEGAVLNYLNLNGNRYTLNSGSWSSNYYSLADGRIARNAVFTGFQKSTVYNATYEITKYDAKATYEGSDSLATYKVKAIVTYEKDSLSITEKIFIGVGLLVLAIAAATILWIFAKKKKDKETGNEIKEN